MANPAPPMIAAETPAGAAIAAPVINPAATALLKSLTPRIFSKLQSTTVYMPPTIPKDFPEAHPLTTISRKPVTKACRSVIVGGSGKDIGSAPGPFKDGNGGMCTGARTSATVFRWAVALKEEDDDCKGE